MVVNSIGYLCAVCEMFMYMHILHIHIYRQAHSIYTHLNVYFEYIHIICIAHMLTIDTVSLVCI